MHAAGNPPLYCNSQFTRIPCTWTPRYVEKNSVSLGIDPVFRLIWSVAWSVDEKRSTSPFLQTTQQPVSSHPVMEFVVSNLHLSSKASESRERKAIGMRTLVFLSISRKLGNLEESVGCWLHLLHPTVYHMQFLTFTGYFTCLFNWRQCWFDYCWADIKSADLLSRMPSNDSWVETTFLDIGYLF